MRNLRKFWLLLAALLAFSATFIPSLSAPAQGQVCQSEPPLRQEVVLRNACEGDQALSISERQFYYTIQGTTASQLVAQIQQHGPLWSDGNRYEAMHTWKMHRTFGVSQEGDRCVLSHPKIVVETSITMPQWQPPANASRELVANWQEYTTALKSHEDGHKDISLAAGQEILNVLEDLPSYPSCDEVRTAAKAAVATIMDRCSQAQMDYDQTTRHGVLQGASYVRWLEEPIASTSRQTPTNASR
jgi:predicted secreted Zn-dependent protease